MRVDFQARALNRGITRTAQSLQSPNDKLGKLLIKGPNEPIDVKEIIQNKELFNKAVNFVKKYI